MISEKPKFYQVILNYIGRYPVLFYILSWTWGILESLLGFLVILPIMLIGRIYIFCNRLVVQTPKFFGRWGWAALGCFAMVSYNHKPNSIVIIQEFGHGIQNIIFGPFTLFIITIPAMIRYLVYLISGKYKEFWFDRQASKLGYYHVYLVNFNKNPNTKVVAD